MIRLLSSLILCLALAGCGEVVVFGHVVRENPAKTEAAAEASAPEHAAEVAAPTTGTEAAASQTAAEPAAPALATVAATPTRLLLHAVNVALTAASQTGNPSVDAAALQEAIRTELRSRNLLDEQSPSADGTAEVLIESATTHPTVNAVIFGRQPMAGTLTGELRVSGLDAELSTARIVAESRFSIGADGEDKNALGPLYRQFAVLTADELSGSARSLLGR
jgi:hypothetical protein